MALDAYVVGLNRIQPCRVHDICARRLSNVLASGTVALFAADVPLCDRLGLDVVVDGMAAVTKRTGRTVRVIRWVELRPPVSSLLRIVGAPYLVRHIP